MVDFEPLGLRFRRQTEDIDPEYEQNDDLEVEQEKKPVEIVGYEEGPHPLISDSLFSLIIFIYVTVVFLYMFYAFCWRDVPEEEKKDDDGNVPPMIATEDDAVSGGEDVASMKRDISMEDGGRRLSNHSEDRTSGKEKV